MSKLNDDMQRAIDGLGLIEIDKKFIEEILYQERINKTKEWTGDAIRSIKHLLDSVEVEDLDD